MRVCRNYIKWPAGGAKKQIIEKHRKRSGFTGCVGFVDGSLLSLHEKPGYEPQLFFNRKKRFMVSSTIICDYDLKILYAQVGDIGTAHDAKTLREGELGKNVEKLFSPREFILGDGAYPKRSWLLPVQRNYKRNQLTGSDIKFNKCISRMRVRIENCFAALKGRFPSVDQLRNKIKRKEDLVKVSDWVLTCCMLHNFCLIYDTNKTLEYFSDVFLNNNIKTQERLNRIASANYLDSLDDEENEYDDVPAGNSLDKTDVTGKKVWTAQKKIVLEDFLEKSISELDKKHAERYAVTEERE